MTTAVTEGGAAASYMFVLGPRGTLRGRVTRADGLTPVSGAQISVLRHQPMEQAGTVVTDGGGSYELTDVNAGQFTLTVIDPATGDRGKGFAKIETEGQNGAADVKLNGQGTVIVTVLDANNNNVPNAEVTLTALGAFLDTRTANTSSSGQVTFAGVMAGDFTVSTLDRPSALVGTALGFLPVGGTLNVSLKLQPVGTLNGVVYGIDGSTLQEGTQVRIVSRERGIITQSVTGPDGAFSFNPLPLSDGPFTLDAFADGRLRARVPGLVLSTPNQVRTQNLAFMPVGTVTGLVSDASGQVYANASVTLQMTEGLRFAFDAKTDANGRFLFGGIPVGSFTLTAVKDGRTGTALGRINADNESVTVNVQLATNSLIGTVYQRDGTTPAAGVTVYLVPRSVPLALTINPNTVGVLSATTNGLGQFGFPIPATDSYTLQAEFGSERGRTPVVITTIDPAHPVQSNVTLLAKGTVTGVVRDSAGQVQANATVKVASVGAFNNTWEVTTNGAGEYSASGVFVGDITSTAQNTTTRLAGASSGRLLAEGDTLVLDVTLASVGRVSGQVLKRDDSVVSGPVRVQLIGGTAPTLELPSGSSYTFDLVPVGDFSVVATEIATGDKGVSYSRIGAANEVKTVNVRMVGQGTITVRTVDESNNPVSGAKVIVKTKTFDTETTINTDGNGEAIFNKIFAGDYTINASKPAAIGTRSGSAAGTLIAEQVAPRSITLTTRPVGTINGILYGPDGVTPRAGMVMRLSPEPSDNFYRAVTDGEGKFQFNDIEGGSSYTLNARLYDNGSCNRDRNRAQATGLQITTQDQVVERDLQMLGSGRVSGKVTLEGGAGIGGIRVRLVNPDPVYGPSGGCFDTAYQTMTAGDGSYALPDVPAGNFTITAENGNRTLRAEDAGRVRFDGDDVTMDLMLVDSAVPMPKELFDANTMRFDIAGDGSVLSGSWNVFSGGPNAVGGMRLDVVVGGVPVPFQNGDGTIGRLVREGREIQVDEVNAASRLKVTRKIFVPKDGYFARYLEVLENPTEDTITVGLRLSSHHKGSNSNARVVDTSDGDQILSVLDATNRDRWAVVDDQQDADPFLTGSTPATGHVFDGTGAPMQVGSAGYELIGTVGKLTWQWDNITVPRGKTVALMHFVFHQLDRSRARQAALRLSSIPPEAVEGLTTDEREAIANFKVPADNEITVPALPALGVAVIQGRVMSGDGFTEIARAPVHIKSKSVLFGRDFTVNADDEGHFEFRSVINGLWNAVAIPLYTFDLDAKHPKTFASTGNAVGDFVAPDTLVVKDLIFNGTGNVRGTVRRHSGGLVEDAFVKICTENNPACGPSNYDRTTANGAYLLSGSNPSDYYIFAEWHHPQEPGSGNSGEPLRASTTTTVTADDTIVADMTMEPTGIVSGIVRAANGDPLENAQVWLYVQRRGHYVAARILNSDTAGRYRFADVHVGAVRVEARDTTSGAQGEAFGTVSTDQESTVDVTLKGFGTINVQVNFARGVPAPAAYFAHNGERFGQGRVDTAGHVSLSLPVGNYSFMARHPDDTQNAALGAAPVDAALTTNGQVVEVTLTLKAAGAVKGTIVRPDGSTLAGGFPYEIRILNGSTRAFKSGQTAPTGVFRTGALPLGHYMLTAYDREADRFADQEFQITADGDEVQVDLVVEDNRIQLPASLFDANRMRFDVQYGGELETGHFWTYEGGGVKLEVNGQAFAGDSSARLEASKRQFAIAQEAPIAGLQVTRKVFVPRGGYFARYLEIFENPTDTPITLDARLTSRFKAAAIIGSATGDTALTPMDSWVVLDDADNEDPALVNEQQPATAHVFGKPGAARPIEADFDVAGDGKGTLVQRWSGITVLPGGKAALMHFVVQQVHRAGATASAERLVQLPPEAIQSLTDSEREAIVNFPMPAPETPTIDALPSLTGSISGRLFEGDGLTAVSRVPVTVQSAHPIFNRVYGMKKDPYPECLPVAGTFETSLESAATGASLGAFSVTGRLTDQDSVVVPEGEVVRVVVQESRGCFGVNAGHWWTHIPSREYRLPASGSVNALFDSGILTGTVRGYADFQVTSGRLYLSIEDPDPDVFRFLSIKPDGTYTYPGARPRTYDVLADTGHPQGTGLRGATVGAVVTLGATTVTDVQLQPAGAIQGAILTANGEASVRAKVHIDGAAPDQTYFQCATGCVPETLEKHKGKRAVSREATADSLGRYSLSAVPPGLYTMTATDPISGARKTVPLTVAENQIATQNVTLLALGSVNLTVNLPNGQGAVDASVFLKAEAEGVEKVVGRTVAGHLTVPNVPVGNYTLRVRDPRHPTDTFYDRTATGTITAGGEVQAKSVTFLASATLQITVVDGDRSNEPMAGADIWLRDVRSPTESFAGTSNAQGVVMNDLTVVPEGAFSLRIRRTLDGTFVEQTTTGSVVAADDSLVKTVPAPLNRTVGSARVTVIDADSGGAAFPDAGIYITHSGSATPEWRGSTDAAGQLLVPGIPIGPFTITAQATISGSLQEAQATGAITAANIGTTQAVQAEFRSTLVSLPRDLRDANQFPYSVEPDGSIARGLWASWGAFNRGAAKLEVNGVPFAGAAQAKLEAGTRQLAITQPDLAGLDVTRKVYVPRGGYFARYLEVFENRSAAPITLDAKVTHRYYNRHVEATSSGDNVVQTTDAWATIDDTSDNEAFVSGDPATAHVIGQPGAAKPLDAIAFSADNGGFNNPGQKLEHSWTQVTVPANGRVALMHFVVQHINRAAAQAAAQRLAQLPPEAIANLTADEIAAIRNFNLPADGVGTVAPLAALTGRVNGRVFEGDNTTPADATVTVKSTHPLFGRRWQVNTGSQGAFEIAGVVNDDFSKPIPVDSAVSVVAVHRLTSLASPTYMPSFTGGGNAITQDVTLPSGRITGRVVSPPDHAIGANGNVTAFMGSTRVGQANGLAADSTFAIGGLGAGTYRLELQVFHPQGSSLTGQAAGVAVTVGGTANVELTVQPTGTITGTVRSSLGAPLAGQSVTVSGAGGVNRQATSDSQGRFTLTTVRVGTFTLSTVSPQTGARTSAPVTVSSGQTTTQDIALAASGTVQLTVRYASGAVANGLGVVLTAPSISGNGFPGTTDANGRLDAVVPAAGFTLAATHPRANFNFTPFVSTLTGALSGEGQSMAGTITLKAVADIRITVANVDQGSAPVANATVTITDPRVSGLSVGITGANGIVTAAAVPQGNFTVRAQLSDGRIFTSSGSVTAANDGATIDQLVAVSDSLDKLGVLTFEHERHLYGVNLEAGQRLDAHAFGQAHSGQPALPAVRINVYGPDKVSRASGNKVNGEFGGQQNISGNFRAVIANTPGLYTITIGSAITSGASALGAYRLVAKVNDAQVAANAYPGGLVQGAVKQVDGVTAAAQQVVSIRTLEALGLYVRTVTDDAGEYRFEGVPAGGFRVAAVDTSINLEVVSATGTLAEATATAPTLTMPARSIFTISVLQPDGSPYFNGVQVTITDSSGTRTLFTNAEGKVVTTGYGELTATASFGNDAGSVIGFAIDGQPVSLTLRLARSSISGFLQDAASNPISFSYVERLRVSDGFYYEYVPTDANGAFTFPVVQAGIPMLLRSYDNNLRMFGTLTVTAPPGTPLTNQIVRMPARGSLVGRVEASNGAGVGFIQVNAVYDSGGGDEIYQGTTTDASGDYAFFDSLPAGVPLRVFATVPVFENQVQVTATIPSAGATATAPPIVFEGASVRVQVQDGAGNTVTGNYILVFAGNYAGAFDGSDFVLAAVPAGTYDIELRVNNDPPSLVASQQVEVGDTGEVLVVFTLSGVTGVVRHASGEVVPSANVNIYSESGDSYYTSTDAQGAYSLVGVAPSPFTLSVNDSESGLGAEETSVMPSEGASLVIDVTLPPSGHVSGVVRRSDGSPIANAGVYLRSSGYDFDRVVYTDDSGAYTARHVGLGHIAASVQDPDTLIVAFGGGVLTEVDQSLVIGLTMPATGSIAGRLLKADGMTPVTSGHVFIEAPRTMTGPYFSVFLTPDALGRFTLAAAPVGTLTLNGRDYDSGLVAAGAITVTVGTTADPQLVMGSGVSFDVVLQGDDDFRYDLTCNGTLIDGGTADFTSTDAYDYSHYLSFDGGGLSCFDAAMVLQADREIRFLPSQAGLAVAARRVFVPASGGYARILDEVTNVSSGEITVALEIALSLGSQDSTAIAVSPPSVQNRYAVTFEDVPGSTDPVLAHVFYDNHPSSLAPVTNFEAGNAGPALKWMLTIPAGQTRSIMTFTVQRPPNGVSAATAQAESLAAKIDPNMLQGLSAQDRANIRNFTLP